jgi:SSS family solute:Na+ symporter
VNLHWIDWAVVLIPLSLVILIGWYTQRYVKGVVEFMTAGRAAGRYLVCNAVGEAQTGAITVIAIFEAWYVSGFAFGWWQLLIAPAMLIVTLTGFVIYRYRESRSMTLAEFFEKRYSKRFRIFMGIVAWISGTVNFAIFPIIGARFFVYYCGFPQQIQLGAFHLPTEAVMMFILLGSALAMALLGGQMTIMVTDCIEGLVSGVMYLIVAVALLWLFPWAQMAVTLSHTVPGKSLLHPFDTGSVQDFNVWYVMISIVGLVYGTMAWQGGHAFKASAANPHEAKMGNTLGVWRTYAKNLMIALLACCAFTYMHEARYAGGAAVVNHSLAQIDNENLRNSMIIPEALSYLLPVGIKGMFAAIMLFALLGCDSSYLHSWGSISAQDVILPFRKGPPLSPRQHMRLIRWCIVFVAVFAYIFGLLYPPGKYILMFFALTGAIFLGGAGAVIIGGFYWKKGTTAGAYAGMITGSTIAVGGIIINAINPNFLINGQWFFFISMVAAVAVYAVVSIMTCREDFNLDRVLHRGPWAVKEYDSSPAPVSASGGRRHWLKAVLGIDHHFTRGDKIQTYVIFGWTMFWFAIFVLFTTWNIIKPWPTSWWATYWHIAGIMFPLVVGVITTTWFTIGGLRDLRVLFKRLGQAQQAPRPFAPDADSDGLVSVEIITPIPVADPEAPVT